MDVETTPIAPLSDAHLNAVFETGGFEKKSSTTENAPKPESSRWRSAEDTYRVLLPCFEGPLDLLLHLIRAEQLNIHDIPIARVCESYMRHLELMQELDLSLAGEFMVMASMLIQIKSQTLLPREETNEPQDDPRAPLVAQLLEYEKFKQAALQMSGGQWLGRDVYGRPAGALSEVLPQESLLDAPMESIDAFALLKHFKVSLDRTTKPPMEISTDRVSIKDKVIAITELFALNPLIEFAQLLSRPRSCPDVIVSFLAVLELAKLKLIEIFQTENFAEIQIRGKDQAKEINLALLDQY